MSKFHKFEEVPSKVQQVITSQTTETRVSAENSHILYKLDLYANETNDMVWQGYLMVGSWMV